jgi:hypothetical protein
MGIVRGKGGRVAGSLWGALLAVPLVLVMTGCETEDYSDHKPPAGQGSLIVDNHTADHISIFLDGAARGEVNDSSDRILDLKPGVYRLVLTEEDGGNRSYGADVDVLEGRLTILEVWTSSDPHAYDVTTRFDN